MYRRINIAFIWGNRAFLAPGSLAFEQVLSPSTRDPAEQGGLHGSGPLQPTLGLVHYPCSLPVLNSPERGPPHFHLASNLENHQSCFPRGSLVSLRPKFLLPGGSFYLDSMSGDVMGDRGTGAIAVPRQRGDPPRSPSDMATSWGRSRATPSGPQGCVSARREVKGLEGGSLTRGGKMGRLGRCGQPRVGGRL